jgi:hypothetical protein
VDNRWTAPTPPTGPVRNWRGRQESCPPQTPRGRGSSYRLRTCRTRSRRPGLEPNSGWPGSVRAPGAPGAPPGRERGRTTAARRPRLKRRPLCRAINNPEGGGASRTTPPPPATCPLPGARRSPPYRPPGERPFRQRRRPGDYREKNSAAAAWTAELRRGGQTRRSGCIASSTPVTARIRSSRVVQS